MATVQLNFGLRTSAHCKTVHLLGSWDNYKRQMPLSKDPSKTGGWKGSFKFQGSTLPAGQRFWYYYIIDGYHVSHDPAREYVTEPTTQRKLNVLDIPKSATAAAATTTSTRSSANRHSRRVSNSQGIKGRSLSPSQIHSPRPTKPHETRMVAKEQFRQLTVDQLTAKFAATASLRDTEDSESEMSDDDDSDSDVSSNVPSLTSRSSNSSSPSSVSSASSCCTCERYGITRAGNRVKLDCGGSRCGSSDGSECSSESEDEMYRARSTRRHGIVVRH